jgi:hypothetical protein
LPVPFFFTLSERGGALKRGLVKGVEEGLGAEMKSLSDFHEKFKRKIGGRVCSLLPSTLLHFFAFFLRRRQKPWRGGAKADHIVLTSASGTLDVQSLVSSGKFEREFGKLES